jgi:hypothetical protein
MAIQLSEDVRHGRLTAIATGVDGGPAAGYIEVRSGTRPANVGVAATGTVLVTFTLADPSFTLPPVAGVMTLDTTPQIDATAAATGTASWARAYDSTGAAKVDGNVGTSGTDFIITSTSVTATQTVSLTAGQLTDPA